MTLSFNSQSLSPSIDREAVCPNRVTCDLDLQTVVKMEIGNFLRILNVRVSVLDINDHAPSFEPALFNLSIPENERLGEVFRLPTGDIFILCFQKKKLIKDKQTLPHEQRIDESSDLIVNSFSQDVLIVIPLGCFQQMVHTLQFLRGSLIYHSIYLTLDLLKCFTLFKLFPQGVTN